MRSTLRRGTGHLAICILVTAGGLAVTTGGALAIPANAPKLGMVCTPGSLSGSTRTFNLVANTGTIETPDGNGIFMWSYANADAPDSGHFQSPGPVLCANEGETVVVNLANSLPEPTSIVFPGQDGQVSASGGTAGLLTREAPAGGSVSYTFPAGSPGTYLYESGSDVTKQVEMGLYGALAIRPALGGDYAYGSAATRFAAGHEYLLLLSEIDPDLHHAVETGGTYDFNAKVDRYFAINGREFPDTIQDNGSDLLPNQPYGSLVRLQPNTGVNNLPTLLRMINVGSLNHPIHPHGNHTRQIAQDGRLLLGPGGTAVGTEHFAETIASGQTSDYLLRWDDPDNWAPSANPFPVAPPNYRDVTFKDANTWYGGSPYLGYRGTLPTGTVSQNICGEWYFPLHSHALNEFANFDAGFGGMATLVRVDPAGGCFAAPVAANAVGGVLAAGSPTALAGDDTSYYQVNPKTTTRSSATTAGQTSVTVASASGFPGSGTFYARIDNEVLRVNSGGGTTTWSVSRGQLGTTAVAHANGATVTSLAVDWYGGFTGIAAGSQNLRVTYKGRTCAAGSTTTCSAVTANLPQQTVKVCDWTVAGAAGCASATSSGWVILPAPPAQPIGAGSAELSSTWTLPGSAANYIGIGANSGQVRVLVHTQRYTASAPTPFAAWGNLLALTYDAP